MSKKGLLYAGGAWAWIAWVVFCPWQLTAAIGVPVLAVLTTVMWYQIGRDSK